MHSPCPLCPHPFFYSKMNHSVDETEAAATQEGQPHEEPFAETPKTEGAAELKAEVEKWKDLALRTAAELDNFRKRSARDMQEARSYANADLLRGLLPVLDTFEMGLEAARIESEQSIVFQGLKMVQGMFANLLKDFGVEEVPAQGKPFDPNLHEALSQEASDTVPEGTILRVQRRGYKLKDRLLRPANVMVSSGPSDA